MRQPQTPSNPTTPLAPGQITIAGSPLPGAASVYRAFRAQRQELSGQLEDLQDTRTTLMRELEQLPAGAPGRAGIEQRIAGIDARIATMDKQIADADAQVAKAAAIPGAVVEPPRFVKQGPPEEFWVISGIFIIVVLLPLSIAYARRIWKRGAAVVTAFPKEIGERLARLEQSAEATALEVERIGEGQRFLTRIFTDGNGLRALGAASPELVERKPGDAGQALR
jgi:hypothetical protein